MYSLQKKAPHGAGQMAEGEVQEPLPNGDPQQDCCTPKVLGRCHAVKLVGTSHCTPSRMSTRIMPFRCAHLTAV
jgi:hypothetical protein